MFSLGIVVTLVADDEPIVDSDVVFLLFLISLANECVCTIIKYTTHIGKYDDNLKIRKTCCFSF